MRLNAQTDFSLRMLMYLAAKGGAPATIQEVSGHLGLSQTHLMRVAAKLSGCGLVASLRGRAGGLRLGRPPQEITVEDVVRAIEPDFSLVQCFDPRPGECSLERACALKGALAAALSAFFVELRAVTLADLTLPNAFDLGEALGLRSPSRLDLPVARPGN